MIILPFLKVHIKKKTIKNNYILDLNPIISIITLNISRLNMPIKGRDYQDLFKKRKTKLSTV